VTRVDGLRFDRALSQENAAWRMLRNGSIVPPQVRPRPRGDHDEPAHHNSPSAHMWRTIIAPTRAL
jgi:hypothetical protein